jgi:ea8.5-like protein
MNQSKRPLLGLAISAGVLGVCAVHGDTIIAGSGEFEDAYKLGNAKFTAGELTGVFENRREMADYIRQVVEENADGECNQCNRD